MGRGQKILRLCPPVSIRLGISHTPSSSLSTLGLRTQLLKKRAEDPLWEGESGNSHGTHIWWVRGKEGRQWESRPQAEALVWT